MVSHSRTRVVLTSIACFIFSLFLMVYSDQNPELAQIGKAVFSDLLKPVQSLCRNVRVFTLDLFGNYRDLVTAREDNQKLRKRLVVLQAENARFLEMAHENQRLKNLLGMVHDHRLKGFVAAVISHDPSNWSEILTIDKGKNDGLKQGLAVIGGKGVVGQIISVGMASARVLLLTDHISAVDALIQDSRVRGIVQGTGSSSALWKYVLSEEEVNVGDRIITSGMDKIYPKGLLIGIISKVEEGVKEKLFQEIEITTVENLEKLETVFVITGIRMGADEKSTAKEQKSE